MALNLANYSFAGVAPGGDLSRLNYSGTTTANGNPFKSNSQEYGQYEQYANGAPGASTSPASSGGGMDWQALYDKQKADQDALAAKNTAAENTRVQGDTSAVNDFVGRYQAAVPQLYDTALTKFNVQPNLDMASALNSRINQLKDFGSLATGGGTANTIDAAVNTHLLPQFETATTNANAAVNAAQGYVAAGTQPFTTEGQMLNDRLAREATGMTTEHTNELNSLLQQMASGTNLSTSAMQRLTALADQENQLEMKKLELQSNQDLKEAELRQSQINAGISAQGGISAATGAASIGSRYKETPGGVVDTSTGNLITGAPLPIPGAGNDTSGWGNPFGATGGVDTSSGDVSF